jgi:Bifunctional DNA primase/polymerase, N-terminal
MEIIVAKKIKFGFGKRRTRTRRGESRRENQRRHRASANAITGNSNRSRLKAALLYGKAGLPVVPLHGVKGGRCTCGDAACDQPERHPRTKGATTDRALIKKYWTKWPKARIGVVLGRKSGVIALVTEGAAGKKTLHALEEKRE